MTLKFATPLVLVAVLGLSACNDPAMQNQVGTGIASAGVAAVAATALGASSGWIAAAAVAGGAAGALYARNEQTKECAYHTGDGSTVTVGTC